MSDERGQPALEVEDQEAPLFTPLKDDVEYVDATEFQKAMLRRMREQEVAITKLMAALGKTQQGLLAVQKSLIRAHEALMAQKAGKPSGLILPERMN